MLKHTISLEFNYMNTMVFTIQETMGELLAVILYEDLNRKGELLRDFAYLIPTYYSSSDEYDDPRNLIGITIFDVSQNKTGLTDKQKDEIECIAEDMMEHRGTVDHKIQWVIDENVTRFINIGQREYLEHVLSFCENEVVFKDIDKKSFSNIRQYDKTE